MKTPREILLTRHQAIEPKLDAIREDIVARLTGPESEQPAAASPPRATARCNGLGDFSVRTAWRQLMLALRWHAAGLGAAWLLVLLLNLEYRNEPLPTIRKQDKVTPRQLLTTYQENRRLLSEIYDFPVGDTPAKSVPVIPARRSDLWKAAQAVA